MTTPFGGFTQIPVGPVPVQVCPPLGVGESVMLYNQDVNNVVTVGTNNNVTQNASNGAPIQPLTSAVLPASKALYATAPTGTAALVIVPEGGTLSPSPVQIAAQIAASGLATFAEQVNQNTSIPNNISTTGAPLLNLYNKITSAVSTAIGSGDSITLPAAGTYPITQIGYEFVIEVGTSQNAAIAPVSIVFTWTDSATGFITATQVYNFYACYTGASGPAHLVEGHGPSNGDQLVIQIFATGAAVTVSYSLLQTSRIYGRHVWRTQNPASVTPAFPTMTYISCVPAANVIAGQTSPSLNNDSITYLLPLYTGNALIWGSIGVAANAGSFLLSDTLSGLSNSILDRWKTSSGDVAPTTMVLPRDQCQLQMSNGTAAASAMSAGIIAQELETN